ncbi:hypothetical protein C8P68_107105 [Mucilaginibacter yixingensis]|uniref:Uncharacterized protein n=1 Tax=Mucilaginibacter yixingensis TaxID=1295612 RepID=A0A2T5J668_9SPHI|nr:hypothetical protein C8P68_107105 [Mucilaginibacter yixingensis]
MNTLLTAFTERFLQRPLISEAILDFLLFFSVLTALYFSCRLIIARQHILQRIVHRNHRMHVVSYEKTPVKAATEKHFLILRSVTLKIVK